MDTTKWFTMISVCFIFVLPIYRKLGMRLKIMQSSTIYTFNYDLSK